MNDPRIVANFMLDVANDRFDAARAHVRARIDAGGPERDAWLSEFCTATWAKSPRKKKS
jgi:hypothetical protein